MAEWLSSWLAEQDDSRSRHLDFQRLVISCFQVETKFAAPLTLLVYRLEHRRGPGERVLQKDILLAIYVKI